MENSSAQRWAPASWRQWVIDVWPAAGGALYAMAIEAGGKDNGAPGLRLRYYPNYYGAFVLNPDGHNIEAVCHEAQ